MPVINRLAEMQPEIAAWRRDLHAHPELLFDVHRTAAFVAEKLRAFGCDEVATGIGRTGVVGLVRGEVPGPTIGLRADMDALPIEEATGLPHASRNAGLMHACGHDGHTAMLLGAAKYLAETRRFAGTVALVFQPAEEGGGGGREMVEDGLMDRFGIAEIYGMHNLPGLPVGEFAIRPGPFLAASDVFHVTIEGVGSHAAYPHQGIDTTLAAAQVVVALQSIVARNTDPLASAVLSVTSFRTETDAFNVIPARVTLRGTVRTLDPAVQDATEERFRRVVANTAAAFGATASIDYVRSYPVMSNHSREAEFAARVAAEVAGENRVDPLANPSMGAEDFAFMLEARRGAFIWTGNGPSAALHHPRYDFNDEAIPHGCSYWVRLVEAALPLSDAAA
jgi:amidohydrolase